MGFLLTLLFYAGSLFVGMLLCGEAGRALASRRARVDPEGAWQGVGILDGAIFALLGLIVAFSFSGAVSRFDERRSLVVQEVNAVGTAYLRLDLLAPDAQPPLRDAFRRYLDSRIEFYRVIADSDAAIVEFARLQQLQADIWEMARMSAEDSQPATMLLLPALNDMFDIAAARVMAAQTHPPVIIFAMLFVLALMAAGLAGYAMAQAKSRNWLHALAFAGATAGLFYVILDLEFPRLGLIRIDAFDKFLIDLANSIR